MLNFMWSLSSVPVRPMARKVAGTRGLTIRARFLPMIMATAVLREATP